MCYKLKEESHERLGAIPSSLVLTNDDIGLPLSSGRWSPLYATCILLRSIARLYRCEPPLSTINRAVRRRAQYADKLLKSHSPV
jgi:hypothetical protein